MVDELICIVQVVGGACGKAYLAMIFQNIKSEISCLVHQAHPKLQNRWKIANSEILIEIECNLVLPTQVAQARTCVTVSNLHSLWATRSILTRPGTGGERVIIMHNQVEAFAFGLWLNTNISGTTVWMCKEKWWTVSVFEFCGSFTDKVGSSPTDLHCFSISIKSQE